MKSLKSLTNRILSLEYRVFCFFLFGFNVFFFLPNLFRLGLSVLCCIDVARLCVLVLFLLSGEIFPFFLWFGNNGCYELSQYELYFTEVICWYASFAGVSLLMKECWILSRISVPLSILICDNYHALMNMV